MPAGIRRGASHLGLAALLTTTALLTAVTPAAADDVAPADRTYRVKVEKVRSIDETGPTPNIAASDEIYVGFKLTAENFRHPDGPLSGDRDAVHAQTAILGNFDAGTTRTVPGDQNCLTPFPNVHSNKGNFGLSGIAGDRWSCASFGTVAPIVITAAMWESDTTGCGVPCGPLGAESVLLRRADGDDAVGTRTTSFSAAGLAADFPEPGRSRPYTVDFTGGGGHLQVTYLVQRTS